MVKPLIFSQENLITAMGQKITVICPWYLNTAIVEHQLNTWNALPDTLKDQTAFILVDDGSPCQIDKPDVDLNLIMVRIKQDIPWNQPGARNLGAHLAQTEYLLFTDIDHEISAEALLAATKEKKAQDTVYFFNRLLNGKPHRPHPCSFVISKQAFQHIGGFDEDFSGCNGYDDNLILLAFEQQLKHGMLDGNLILQTDGATPSLDRNHSRNALLYQRKKQAVIDGIYRNENKLRFDWEVVHTFERVCLDNQSHQGPYNPIFEYASKAQSYEKEENWKQSVHWYYRAIACFPNLYGTKREISSFPGGSAESVSFTPQHAARLYSALGRCLRQLNRIDDSHMAFRAAHYLSPEDHPAQSFLGVNSKIALEDAGQKPTSNPYSTNIDLEDSVTIIMVTHCSRRLKKFGSLSPPSNKLVTATYGSMLKLFGDDINECLKVLCYDYNPSGMDCDAQYARALERFSEEYGFDIVTYPKIGLFNILNKVIKTITTPYIFFAEHDWMFKGDAIKLQNIVAMMNEDSNMNSIRFNKRENHINGHDFILSAGRESRYYPLLKTSSHSNNPSILRTEKLKNEWLPACEEALQMMLNNLGGSAFGVEEILFKLHAKDIREMGFDEAHEKWGTYVFGQAGDPPRILHLGE